MTTTPNQLPPYLIDAAASFDKESEACGWTSNAPTVTAEYIDAFKRLEAAIGRAFVDAHHKEAA
ncbi:hypothetical protein CWR43_27950 [Rhizobium sullae]|uniref:Uncharacterized protein n=1 Tax=Rhizobium sullae TaxID=50338 RepID=A0A2N0D2Y3_RHISU|nr:hypothetical protein [Rhizobium sullae]PKA40417.1 hypothetical protein CWR43_27950 [Rhizobium sullae]